MSVVDRMRPSRPDVMLASRMDRKLQTATRILRANFVSLLAVGRKTADQFLKIRETPG